MAFAILVYFNKFWIDLMTKICETASYASSRVLRVICHLATVVWFNT